jgi:hypothetical protein
MKRTLSILMIFLIIFNAGGYFFIFSQFENYFKEKATARISDYIPLEKLEKIKIVKSREYGNSNSNFEKINDNELKLNGNLYDIYYQEDNGDTTTLYCISDKYEDILHEAFSKYLNGQKDENNNTALSNLIKIFLILGLEPVNDRQLFVPFTSEIKFIKHTIINDTNLDIPVPPPRFITG